MDDLFRAYQFRKVPPRMRTSRLCVSPGRMVDTATLIPAGFGLFVIRLAAVSTTNTSPGSSPSDQYSPDSPSQTACRERSCPKLRSRLAASCLMARATVTWLNTICGNVSAGILISATGRPVDASRRRATTSAGSPCMASVTVVSISACSSPTACTRMVSGPAG